MSTQTFDTLITLVEENLNESVPLRNLQVRFYAKLFGLLTSTGSVEYDHTFFYYKIGDYSNVSASKDILISRINETTLQINDIKGNHIVNRYDPGFLLIRLNRVN